MRIEHIGLWVRDLERMKDFYSTYFGAESSPLYHNRNTGFRSYFLSFASGARLELMHRAPLADQVLNSYGYAHIAFVVGDPTAVDQLAERFQRDGLTLKSGPRVTGDGYYEAVVEDPEGNSIEITASPEGKSMCAQHGR